MKKVIYQPLLFLFFISTLWSCSESDDETPTPVVDDGLAAIVIDETPLESVDGFVALHGDKDSNTVIVNTQGGPVFKLDSNEIERIIKELNLTKTLFANVHQVQTKNPEEFKDQDITFEQAKKYDKKSVANLKRVIDFYKRKEKKVYVLGISFGAFMTQELIASYGTDIADGFVIMVGRLNMDEGVWQSFSQGKGNGFEYDSEGKATITEPKLGETPQERNSHKLAAGLGFNRYTDRLKDIADLSKVTYVYGNRDEAVGPLSDKEVQFLKSKKADVRLFDMKGHGGAVDEGLPIFKEKFKLE